MIYSIRSLFFFLVIVFSSVTSWSQLTFLDPATNLPTTSYTLSSKLCQGASVDHCINVVSAGTSHSITSHSGSLGTIVIAPPSNPLPRCFRYTAPFGFTGPNTITFTVTNNLGQTGTLQITIVVVNPNTPINSGPDQQLCSPVNSTTLNAISPDPLAIGYWTKLTGPGSISGGTDSPAIAGVDQQGGANVNVSGLQLGSNIFIWHQDYPCDSNVDIVIIYVYNGFPPVADANICYPTTTNHVADTVILCGTTSYTLCANNPGTAATGTWTIFGGCGTIFNINNANAPVTNLCAGCNNFEWNIGNGPCPGGETKDTVVICVYPSIQTAIAPPAVTRCLGSFTTVSLVGNALVGANTAQWTFVSGPLTPGITTPTTSSTTITGLTQPGVYCFNYTITSGPCGSSTSPVCISVYSPTSPVVAGLNQVICLPSNSATMAATPPTFPATGTWSVVSGTGSFASPSSPTSVVNGLSVDINTFRWTVNNGNCANNGTSSTMTVTVFPVSQPAADAGPNMNLTYSGTPLSVTLAGNNPTAPGTGNWTISPVGPVITTPSSPSSTVTNLTPGVYTLTWCLNNGSCSAPVCANMTINVFNCQTLTTNAGPDQNFCTPTNSVTLDATVAVLPATGVWTTITGGGSFSSTSNPTATVTNIPIGINTYRWTVTNGGCGSFFDDIIVNIFNNSTTTSNAGTDQEFCASGGPGSAVMSANTPVAPATGTWTALGSGTISSANSPTATMSALPVGAHNFVWTVSNGPCGMASDTVQVRVYAQGQTAANAGPDQNLCSTNSNTTVVGNNLVNPASGTWTIITGGGTIVSPNTSATAINTIPVGINTYRWTIYNGPCANPLVLTDDVVINVFSSTQPAANAGPDQNVCSTSSSIALSGTSVTSPSTGLWSVSPTGPVFSNNSIPNPTVTSLTPGTIYAFTWTVNNGTCSSTSDAMILNYYNNVLPASNAGPDQSICLPINSVTLAGNPATGPATGTWSLQSGPNVPTFTANNNASILSNLITGTYTMRWTVNNGACSPSSTFDDVVIFVYSNTQLVANAGPDQELCTPVSIATLTGNVLQSPATGLWTQISGPNTATINNPNLVQVDASGLIVGCYAFRWTVTNGSCTPPSTFDEVLVCVNSNLQTTSDAGLDQILCSPIATTTLEANAIIFPAVGTWTVVSAPNVPFFSSVNSSTATLSNLIVGTYVLRWCIYNGSCSNPNPCDDVIIQVFETPAPAANAGPDILICTPTDNVFMVANAATSPAVGTWSIITGSGAIVGINDPLTQITNLPVGANCFKWTINNGGCGVGTTMDTVCVNVFNANQPLANAGADQDMCTPTSSTNFQGNNPIVPAIGTWTQLSGPSAADIANPNAANSALSGLDVGCYEFIWTINNGACVNPISADTVEICVFNSGFDPANGGPDMELCSPISTVIMAAEAAVDPGEGTWIQISGPTIVTFSDINDSLATVSDLIIGTYVFEWSLNYASCGSEADQITITILDSTQGAAFGGPDQTLCTPTSSALLAANPVLPPGFGTWSTPSATIDFQNEQNPTTTALNLSQGINTLIWTVYNGPCLAQEFTVDTVIVFINDVNQPESNAGDDQLWCTPHNFATLAGTPLSIPATGLWTTTGTATIVSPTNPTTDVTDLPVGVTTFCWTISNGSCDPPQTTDCVDVFIFPVVQLPANAGSDQDVCGTATNCATLEGNAITFPAVGTWSQIGGVTTTTFSNVNDPNAEVCGMVPGVYTFQWCIDNGPCGSQTCDQMTITIFDDTTGPATLPADIEMCMPANNAMMSGNVANLPGFGVWTLLSGGGIIDDIDNPETLISAMPVGINSFSWCIFNGVCANASTCDTINISVFENDISPANAGPDQDWCDPIANIFMQATPASSPAVGTWTAIGNTATIVNPNDPNSEVTGIGVGVYTFMWTVYNGPCANTNTTDLITIRVFEHSQPAANAGSDIEFCTPQNSAQMVANVPIYPATGYWNIVGNSTGTVQNIASPTTMISSLIPGIHQFSWSISNGPCIPNTTTDTIAIHVFNHLLPPAEAGLDLFICAPADLSAVCSTLNGSMISGAATGLWTQVSGPTVADLSDPTINAPDACNLLIGQYTFMWSVNNGPCGSSLDTVHVMVNNPGDSQPFAGEDAFYCTPTSTHVMSATAPTPPSFGYWQSISPSVIVEDINDPNTLISNLTVGQHIFLWHFNNGACAPESFDDISIFVYDEFNPEADAGVDIELCLPLNEVVMSASYPLYPAVGQWSVVEGCSSVQIGDVNDPISMISGLCLGTQCLLWTVDNGPCPAGLTMDTICIRVFDPGIDVEAGPDQSMCTPQVSAIMDATVPQDPNYGTWANNQGGGTIINPSSATTTIDDLPVGINCFTWEIYNGTCVNALPSDGLCISVFDQAQPPANAGSDVELCFPITSVTLHGNMPTIPATGSWALVSGTGIIASPQSIDTDVSEMSVGYNVFTWTIDNGPCLNPITVDTVVVRVYPDNPQIALAGSDLEICTPETMVVMSANAPGAPSSATWIPVSLSGLIINENDPNTIVDFLTVGIHEIEWHVYNGPCNPESVDAVSIFVYDATAPEANAGDDIEICSPSQSTTMNGNAATAPGTGLWSLGNHPGSPILDNPSDASTAVQGLAIGVTELVWTLDNGACGMTADTMRVIVFDPTSPSATVANDTVMCDPPACVNLIGSIPIPPAYGWWEQIAGDVMATINDSLSFATTACGLALNESAFVWHVYNGPCANGISSDTLWFYIYDSQVGMADAGTDTAFCGALDSYPLDGSQLVGSVNGLATGTWTGPNGTITNPNAPDALVLNIPTGVNCYTWTVENGACGTSSDQMCITIYDPMQQDASAGDGNIQCANQFVSFNLMGNEVIPPATGLWSVISGPADIEDENSNDALVTYLGIITTPLQNVPNTLLWTIDNGVCGTSSDSIVFEIEDCETIKIPDAFSPNGDGMNDEFFISNLSKYPNNNIQIFNRWGAQIFNAAPYKGDWRGQSTAPGTIGEILPVSTYYYVLSIGSNYAEEPNKVFTGFVYLKR